MPNTARTRNEVAATFFRRIYETLRLISETRPLGSGNWDYWFQTQCRIEQLLKERASGNERNLAGIEQDLRALEGVAFPKTRAIEAAVATLQEYQAWLEKDIQACSYEDVPTARLEQREIKFLLVESALNQPKPTEDVLAYFEHEFLQNFCWEPVPDELFVSANEDARRVDSTAFASHSADFRSVLWKGTQHDFTESQSRVVMALWEAWENGTPVLSDATLLEAIDHEAPPARLDMVFRDSSAWKELIVSGQRKGTKKLNFPELRAK